jgi:hypothetical protein
MTTELIAGLKRAHAAHERGAVEGLKAVAAGVTLDMRNDPAHGDQTGASHANYQARAVGEGEDGGALLSVARAAASALNPGEVGPTSQVRIDGIAGVILDSQLNYSPDLEQENAGEKAVIGPTLRASGTRFTAGAARGMKKAWGG